ncbi:MAG: endonuclease/exonuclease/phosphatase family protein [Bacteroidota bacterium]
MTNTIIDKKPVQLTIGALIVLGTLICVFTPNYFLFKMGARFAVHIMIGYLLLAIVFLIFRQTRLMFTSFACCAGLCLFLKHASNADLSVPLETKEDIVQVAHVNLSASEEDYEQTIQSILQTKADLISIQEVTPDWREALQTLQSIYPHSSVIESLDPFGIAVYSKFPFIHLDTLQYENIPTICGQIKAEGIGKPIHFISTHTTPPLFSSAYEKMQAHFQMLNRHIRKVDLPIITLGDFHAPPWWAEIQELKETGQLVDSRRSASYGFSDVFQIPVDYILYSDNLTCTEFKPVHSVTNSSRFGIQGTYQFISTLKNASQAN